MTLLTQREAASVLRLSERTLERWRVAGIGPRFIRLPRRSIRYPAHGDRARSARVGARDEAPIQPI